MVEHFKAKAGDRGYQTLINEALKQAIQAETIETVVRKTIREELRRVSGPTAGICRRPTLTAPAGCPHPGAAVAQR